MSVVSCARRGPSRDVVPVPTLGSLDADGRRKRLALQAASRGVCQQPPTSQPRYDPCVLSSLHVFSFAQACRAYVLPSAVCFARHLRTTVHRARQGYLWLYRGRRTRRPRRREVDQLGSLLGSRGCVLRVAAPLKHLLAPPTLRENERAPAGLPWATRSGGKGRGAVWGAGCADGGPRRGRGGEHAESTEIEVAGVAGEAPPLWRSVAWPFHRCEWRAPLQRVRLGWVGITSVRGRDHCGSKRIQGVVSCRCSVCPNSKRRRPPTLADCRPPVLTRRQKHARELIFAFGNTRSKYSLSFPGHRGASSPPRSCCFPFRGIRTLKPLSAAPTAARKRASLPLPAAVTRTPSLQGMDGGAVRQLLTRRRSQSPHHVTKGRAAREREANMSLSRRRSTRSGRTVHWASPLPAANHPAYVSAKGPALAPP